MRPIDFRHWLRSRRTRLQRGIKRAVQNVRASARDLRIVLAVRLFRKFPSLVRWYPYVFHWFLGDEDAPPKIMNQCIYCDSTTQLSDEHIVPINLGGHSVLYKASCECCRLKIHPVETEFLKYFRDIRYRLGIGKRNLKSRTTKVRVRCLVNWDGKARVDHPPGANPNQKWEWREVLYEEHATPLFLPRFKLPGMMRGLSPAAAWQDHFDGPWFHNEPVNPSQAAMPMWVEEKIGNVVVARTLAKIAHGMAIWTFGRNSFESFLTDIILGKDLSKTFFYVGGRPGLMPPHKTHLHIETARGNLPGSKEKLVFVEIRLFADRGPPAYRVIAGRYLQN